MAYLAWLDWAQARFPAVFGVRRRWEIHFGAWHEVIANRRGDAT